MGGESAAHESRSDADRRGPGPGAARSLEALRDENERLRRELAERVRDQRRIVDRYETLLDAARADADREAARRTPAASAVGRLLERLRR
ncbi:hypothetical protein [Halobaculum litoreum]|uniref:Uncharacterized protein n=1 Tax=Halobaculum litoreum TaxID=3031998 RepID=A0ABD5XMP0_9EURY|nr:hypothetical protein [Halobaculum sp. DT92]